MGSRPDNYEYRCDAFISYRQVEPDKTIAERLHKLLEAYRTPRNLVRQGTAPRLKRVFRDWEELAASSNLTDSIKEALTQSHFLIVVCSRETPKSEWVAKEIETFQALGRGDRILALLIDGEPQESFPLPLRQVTRTAKDEEGFTREVIETVEPLAADIRAHKASESLRLLTREKLKLLAAILGTRFDDLRQREHERFVRRLIIISIVMFILTMSFACLAAYALIKRREAVERSFVSIAQALAVSAIRQSEEAQQHEQAVLLAIQAHKFNKRYGGDKLAQIDEALRKAVKAPNFSVILGDETLIFTSVTIDKGGRLLAASARDGTVHVWDLIRRTALPPLSPAKDHVLDLTSQRKAFASAPGPTWEMRDCMGPMELT